MGGGQEPPTVDAHGIQQRPVCELSSEPPGKASYVLMPRRRRRANDMGPGLVDESSSEALRRTSGGLMENRDV